MAWCTYLKLWYINNSPFTSYTTVTPYCPKQFFAYVTSHIYTYVIACIDHATMLWGNIMRVTHVSIKQVKGLA